MYSQEKKWKIERSYGYIKESINDNDFSKHPLIKRKKWVKDLLKTIYEYKSLPIDGSKFKTELKSICDKMEKREKEFNDDNTDNYDSDKEEFNEDEPDYDETEIELEDTKYTEKKEKIRNQYRSIPMPKNNKKIKIFIKNRARIKFIEVLRGLIDFKEVKKNKNEEIILRKTQKEIAEKLGMREWQISRDVKWGLKNGFIKKKNNKLIFGIVGFKPIGKTNKSGKMIYKPIPSWFKSEKMYIKRRKRKIKKNEKKSKNYLFK